MILQRKFSDGLVILSVNYDELMKKLKEISAEIKNKLPSVQKIFLFGSFAKGNYTPESDVDILVILDKCETPFIERRDIFIDFFDDVPFDLNIFAYTSDEIQKMIEQGNLFIRNVLSEAIEI